MKEQKMQQYFSVCGCKIPIELRPLYEEVSTEFEKKVFNAITPEEKKKNEKTKEISKKSHLT